MASAELQKAIESNPCGKCRAMGMPSCSCKKGGGGGGPEGEEANDAVEAETTLGSTPKLEPQLTASALWQENENKEDAFEYQNSSALVTLTLDVHNCKLTYEQKKDLTAEERAKVTELYQSIKQELADFKNEMAGQGIDVSKVNTSLIDGKLEIQFSDPKMFDAFVDRLMQKNMLPTKMPELDKLNTQTQMASLEQEQQQAKAPNPFDINSGPKPSDGFSSGE